MARWGCPAVEWRQVNCSVLLGYIYSAPIVYIKSCLFDRLLSIYFTFSCTQTYTKLLRHSGQVLWLLLLNQRNKHTEWKVFLHVAQRLFGVCISVEMTE